VGRVDWWVAWEGFGIEGFERVFLWGLNGVCGGVGL